MLGNVRKFKNLANLLLLFVKITKFLEFSTKITIKTIVILTLGCASFQKAPVVPVVLAVDRPNRIFSANRAN